jgi:hypothetical protein
MVFGDHGLACGTPSDCLSLKVKVLNMETSFYVGQAFRPAYSKAKALPYVNFTSTYFLLSL